eukprot:1185745-Prorocentrum_minimum.AAC.1
MDVQSLNLAGNEIDDYAMKYLAEALPEHLKQLRALNIGRTSITQQSVRTVAPALRKCRAGRGLESVLLLELLGSQNAQWGRSDWWSVPQLTELESLELKYPGLEDLKLPPTRSFNLRRSAITLICGARLARCHALLCDTCVTLDSLLCDTCVTLDSLLCDTYVTLQVMSEAIPEVLRPMLHKHHTYKTKQTSIVLRPVSPPRDARSRLNRYDTPQNPGGFSYTSYLHPDHELGARVSRGGLPVQ